MLGTRRSQDKKHVLLGPEAEDLPPASLHFLDSFRSSAVYRAGAQAASTMEFIPAWPLASNAALHKLFIFSESQFICSPWKHLLSICYVDPAS